LYKALKDAKKLIAYESELINNAKCGSSVPSSRQANLKSARA
jgi:flagellar biosynthesis regulator FlbT